MTFPTTFANLAAGNQPASLLDTMFNIAGAAGAIPCTATGTNAITLTPVTNYYLPAAYANYQIVSFVAANNATGAVTIQLGALAFVNLYMPSGLQANSGDINANVYYIAAYNGALNSGSGGFQVFNASTPSVIQPVVGSFKNLFIANGGTPDSQVAVTADQVMLGTAGGGTARVTSVNVTISTGTNGANGLDSGTIAQATWYSVWVIYNGSTIAGLLSTSATSPTLPSGYTYYARVGWVRTGGASTNLVRLFQKGREAYYVVTPGSQTATLPLMSSGATGNVSVPSWTAVSTSTFVPPTASIIHCTGSVNTNGTNNMVIGMAAPNNNYGAYGSETNPPPVTIAPVSGTFSGGGTSGVANAAFSLFLETSNIYWIAAGTGVTAALACRGWQDNL